MPWIMKKLSGWFGRFMAGRAEDMMRRMMGMPSRKEEKRRARKNRKTGKEKNRTYSGASENAPSRSAPAAEMMQSVAVDVQYTEIKEFDSTTIVEDDGKSASVYHEEQVTDVEFIEIKEK